MWSEFSMLKRSSYSHIHYSISHYNVEISHCNIEISHYSTQTVETVWVFNRWKDKDNEMHTPLSTVSPDFLYPAPVFSLFSSHEYQHMTKPASSIHAFLPY